MPAHAFRRAAWGLVMALCFCTTAASVAHAQMREMHRELRRVSARLKVHDFEGARRHLRLAEAFAERVVHPERRRAAQKACKAKRMVIDREESRYWQTEVDRLVARARAERTRGAGARSDRLVRLLLARAESAAQRIPLANERQRARKKLSAAREALLPQAPVDPPPSAAKDKQGQKDKEQEQKQEEREPQERKNEAESENARTHGDEQKAPPTEGETAPKSAAKTDSSAGTNAAKAPQAETTPTPAASTKPLPPPSALPAAIAAIEPRSPSGDQLKRRWLRLLGKDAGACTALAMLATLEAAPSAGSPVVIGPLVPAPQSHALDGPVFRLGEFNVVLIDPERLLDGDGYGEPRGALGVVGWIRESRGVVDMLDGRPRAGSARLALTIEVGGVWGRMGARMKAGGLDSKPKPREEER